jgi:hypothetical protein
MIFVCRKLSFFVIFLCGNESNSGNVSTWWECHTGKTLTDIFVNNYKECPESKDTKVLDMYNIFNLQKRHCE